jgi:hypothetical protein
MLNLPVPSGVCYGGLVNSNVVVVTEPEELLPRELCAIVGNDGVWYSKTVDDVGEEFQGLFEYNCSDRPYLYPLRELVDGNKQVRVATKRPL